jgi:hypothetical protein
MLDAWASVAPIDSLVCELMAFLLSAKCTADGKADGIQWLATQVGIHHQQAAWQATAHIGCLPGCVP